MKGITHIFFDLDHTLWDYDYNSRKVLLEIYQHFKLDTLLNNTPEGFLKAFYRVNASLWSRYNSGEIDRETIRSDRFYLVFKHCGLDDRSLGSELSKFFIHNCPRQPKIIDDADVLLNYLQGRYQMSIITNGFNDVQEIKMKSSNLERYFDHVFTSETIGSKKPDPGIFHHALSVVGATPEKVLMIGDNPRTDILGARNAGIVPILYNPTGTAKSDCELQVTRLGELIKIL